MILTKQLMESEIDELSRENARLAANVRQLEESVNE
jgi:cell division protein FtsB